MMTTRGKRPPNALTKVRALAHPVRLRLIELFAAGPLTAKQAAEKLGLPPTRLYHHVATLERAGLLTLARTRAVRGATEKYFEVSRESLRSVGQDGLEAMQKATPQDRAAISSALFDRARIDLTRALGGGALEKKHHLMAIRALGRLTPEEARRVHRDLLAIVKRLRRKKGAERPSRKLVRYSLTIAMIPTEDEASP